MITLTDEQKAIIDTVNNDDKVIKINAVAGASKTFTMLEVAKKIRETDKDSKILYIVFNRSMVEESKKKFADLKLNVECQTTHGFALKRFSALKDGEVNVVPALDFNMFMEVKNKKQYVKQWIRYKVIADLLDAYCLTYDSFEEFCENIYKKADQYGIQDKPSFTERDFFAELYKYMIDNHTYTHGMYLKLYACECNDKITSYKYLLLDEAQDTNAMFYCILKRMQYKKLYIVGDTKQNIYQFCKTINIFDKIDGKDYTLSKSFRINDEACKLANRVLAYHYKDYKKGFVKNYFNRTEIEDKTKKTILFRLNSTMFEYATNLISKTDNIKVHFMNTNTSGNADKFEECFNDMLYFYYRLLDSYDKLKAQDFKKSFKFNTCKTVDNLIKVAQKENMGLYHYLCRNKGILSLDFSKYFNFFIINELDIIDIVNKVKNSEECENPNREYFLSTCHRYKGLEAEFVKIAPDAWSLKSDAECNLCYVAVTRATKKLDAKPIIELLNER